MAKKELPVLIQGGMGVGVSGWKLARAIAMAGQLGVVSGTALDAVMVRRLQSGDQDGAMRTALGAFPMRQAAANILNTFYIPFGKDPSKKFKANPIARIDPTELQTQLTIAANFAEVYLAKLGHCGKVGINLLEKIQLPTLQSLYGALLAGVDYVLMGAGIPRQIPALLDKLAALNLATLKLDVDGAMPDDHFSISLDPKAFEYVPSKPLHRPLFLGIVSSTALATSLVKRCDPPVDGLILEGPLAGGHNAPPRGQLQLDQNGEPIYGERDKPDLDAIKELDKPFWLAGAWGKAGCLQEALNLGAAGIQVGTAFAFCAESGIAPEIKARVLQSALNHDLQVVTDPVASPTGFPFKVVNDENSVYSRELYESRERVCDLGYLRTLYKKEDGSVGYRCPAEPVEDYVRKGGSIEDTVGRKCVCNGLLSTIGLPQSRAHGLVEPPLITAGNEAVSLGQFLKPDATSYSAQDVIDLLVGDFAL